MLKLITKKTERILTKARCVLYHTHTSNWCYLQHDIQSAAGWDTHYNLLTTLLSVVIKLFCLLLRILSKCFTISYTNLFSVISGTSRKCWVLKEKIKLRTRGVMCNIWGFMRVLLKLRGALWFKGIQTGNRHLQEASWIRLQYQALQNCHSRK